MTGKPAAAIDFGTNTARLLIAVRHADGTFEPLHIEREIVRMGGGFSREQGLAPDAVQRGLACLTRFAEIMDRYRIPCAAAAATSAVRDAVNGRDFVAEARRLTGIELAVIDGESEGRLTLAGVISGLGHEPERLMVFDVGGGSTEYTLATGGSADYVSSLPLGVVRLTEGISTPDGMREKIGRELDRLVEDMGRSGRSGPAAGTLLVGTAGTATTLAAIRLKMVTYDYRIVNNSLLTIDEIRDIYRMLLPLTPRERLSVPGLEKGREDLIIAGTLITMMTMERFGFTTMTVSDFGLLEGLLVCGIVPPP